MNFSLSSFLLVRKLVTDMYSWMEQFRSHQINAEATLNEFEREVSALSQERERRALKIDQWNKRLQRSLQHYNFSYDPIGGSLASSYRLKPPPPPRNGVHAWGGQVGSFESDFGETEEEETETETESVVEGEERAFTMYKGKSSSSFGISGGIDIPSLMYEDYSHIPDLSEEELQAALFVIEQNQTDYLQELQELEEKEEYKE